MAISLSFQVVLPINMWTFSTQHVVRIINRLPTCLLKYKSPYEMLYQEPPLIIHLKVFGCLCYAYSLLAHRSKFYARARNFIFLSFKDGTKGYILYNINSHNIFFSIHVMLYETRFPFKTHESTSSSPLPEQDPS